MGRRSTSAVRCAAVGRVVAGLVLLGTLTAGGGAAAGAGEPPPTVGATTTSSPAPPPPVGTPPLEPDPAVVRTPEDAAEPLCALDLRRPDGLDPEADAAEADALLGMMSVVNTYGVPLGQEFRGSGQSRDASGRRIVIASFVANVAEHRAALAELVDEPDLLLVCRARLAVGEGNALVAELTPLLPDFTGYGPGGLTGQVTVNLGAGHEALAELLHETYGDRLDLTLGAFPYPLSDPLPATICPELPAPHEVVVSAVVDGPPIVVAATDRLGATVAAPFMNASSEPIAFMTGYPLPRLVDPATGAVVGVPNAGTGIADVGLRVDLEPGEATDSEEFSTWVPTAACDPALGYTVPPGDYHLYAVYDIVGDAVNVDQGEFAVGPIPVTVVAPPA